MICPKCSKEIPDNSTFCNHCGEKITLPEPELEQTSLVSNTPADSEQKHDNTSQSSSKSIMFFILLLPAIVIILAYCCSRNSSKEDASATPTPTVESFDTDYDDYAYDFDSDDSDSSYDDYEDDTTSSDSEITVSNFYKRPKFTAKKNTTEMVDQIALTAKANIDSFTSKDAKKIIKAIRSAQHKYYKNNTTMERFMWYGCLLDYKYDDSDPRSELGTDLYQAIKYVYRGAEDVTDDSTQENLRQIDDSLSRIN